MRIFGVIAIVAFALSLTIGTHRQLLAARAQLPPEADLLLLPRASALRAMSLRHTELAADLVFIRALIYYGTEISRVKSDPNGSFRWIENYLDTIVALDPYFKTAYRWAGTAMMYNGKDITNDAVMISNRLLERGSAQFPRDWELPFMVGCNYLYELKTKDEAEHERWHEIGSAYIQRAAAIGNGPQWLPSLAATLLKHSGQTELAIRHLEEAYLLTQDEKAKTDIRNQLFGLLGQNQQLEELQGERDRFNAAWKKEAPYLPADLFVILGERPSTRIDWRYLAEQAAN